MFDFIRIISNKRKFKKNMHSKRYRYDVDGKTKIFLEDDF